MDEPTIDVSLTEAELGQAMAGLRALDAAERGRDTVRAEAKLYRAVLEFYLNEYARARFVLATPREESFSPEMELLLREFKEGKKTGDRR